MGAEELLSAASTSCLCKMSMQQTRLSKLVDVLRNDLTREARPSLPDQRTSRSRHLGCIEEH